MTVCTHHLALGDLFFEGIQSVSGIDHTRNVFLFGADVIKIHHVWRIHDTTVGTRRLGFEFKNVLSILSTALLDTLSHTIAVFFSVPSGLLFELLCFVKIVSTAVLLGASSTSTL